MKTKTLLALSSLTLFSALSVAAYAQGRDPAQTFEALRKRLDTDLDGRISETEFPRGKVAFRRLDRDRDGFLTAADFVSSAKTPAAAPTNEREPTAEEVTFFETKIRPVLATSCYGCHAETAAKVKGGLKVDSRAALLAGGSTGPAIVPGDADGSLLIQAVRYTDSDFAMPPKKQLDAAVVKDLERWIDMGAPWPRAQDTVESTAEAPKTHKVPLDVAKAREYWAFRAPVRTAPPATKNTTWAWNEVDRFLLASMEKAGVAPVADADKRTWLRRVTFDLTGLPPTPEEQVAFEADRSDQAYAKVVDRLLASPAYGERWGRHWLDVARYAESSGKDTNVAFPQAWRYRDWAIAAFRDDKPYDRFLKEQIAGDLQPAASEDERAQNLIATGYLALGSKSLNTRDKRQFALDVADEQIDAIGQGMLGMTLACARCHDHKFDPIPIEDYYGLAGIFLSTDTRYGTKRGPGNTNPGELVTLPAGANVPNGPTMDPIVRAFFQRALETVRKIAEPETPMPRTGDDAVGPGKKPDGTDLVRQRFAREQAAMIEALLARFDDQGRALPANRLAMGALEGNTRDIAVLERGELDKPAGIAPRGVPRVLRADTVAPIAKGSGRHELADWIASSENPLTARVWVNRVWLHLFGSGIVRTPDNFGTSGQRPDHPELLDWLATEFVAQGWSTKQLVRELVLSHAYRLASTSEPAHAAKDPEAVTRWRMPDRRLEAEAIRDAMLAVSGTLSSTPPVGSAVGVVEGPLQREEVVGYVTRERPVRSVYLPSLRDHLPEALDVFDAPDSAFVTGDREETNVATQALFLMNDDDVLRAADAFADRLLAKGGDDDARIAHAFQLAFGRAPTGSETSAVRSFLSEFERAATSSKDASGDRREARDRRDRRTTRTMPGESTPARITDPKRAAWSAFAQSLFQSAEFRSIG